jgi:hypothetical protein
MAILVKLSRGFHLYFRLYFKCGLTRRKPQGRPDRTAACKPRSVKRLQSGTWGVQSGTCSVLESGILLAGMQAGMEARM